MASSTAHPNHQLISSEDVEGTEVYGVGDENVGEIDHLIIDKLSGRVIYAVWRSNWTTTLVEFCIDERAFGTVRVAGISQSTRRGS